MGHNSISTNKKETSQNPADSRRSFLKNSSAILAGTTIANGTLPISRSAYAAGDDTIKLGLVGCGGRGTGAASQALAADQNTKIVALGDAFEKQISSSKRSLKGEYKDRIDTDGREFGGLDAFRRVIESDIDMVLLATPPGFRPLHFETAVKAGKHVFMEKPVATDAPGVRRVLEANKIAQEKKLVVAVGLQRHHESGYRAIIRELQNGAIGEIILARAYWNADGVWTRARQPEQTELEYQMNNWYYFNWLSGDHIVEQHIHNLDVINWLMNSHPVTAQGQGGREVRKGPDSGQIFDHHMIEFTYPNGTKLLSQCRHIPNTWGAIDEYAHGSKGWADISGGKIYDSKNKVVWTAPENENGHKHEHVEIFKSIRNGEIPNEGDNGAYSTMTAIMGRMATYSGKMLSWDDCFNSKLALADFDSLKSFKDTAPLQPDDKGNYFIPVPGESIKKVL